MWLRGARPTRPASNVQNRSGPRKLRAPGPPTSNAPPFSHAVVAAAGCSTTTRGCGRTPQVPGVPIWATRSCLEATADGVHLQPSSLGPGSQHTLGGHATVGASHSLRPALDARGSWPHLAHARGPPELSSAPVQQHQQQHARRFPAASPRARRFGGKPSRSAHLRPIELSSERCHTSHQPSEGQSSPAHRQLARGSALTATRAGGDVRGSAGARACAPRAPT